MRHVFNARNAKRFTKFLSVYELLHVAVLRLDKYEQISIGKRAAHQPFNLSRDGLVLIN